MGIEWRLDRGCIVYYKKDDESVTIAVLAQGDNGTFNLAFDPCMKRPLGIEDNVLFISQKTAEWLALAVAEHNGVA